MKKRRFTWLDGLICGVVALAVVAGVMLFVGRGDGNVNSSLKTYEMTLRFTQATEDPYDYYKVGDTMYFQNRTAELGVITELALLDYYVEEFDPVQGVNVQIKDPERKVVEMKLQVQGTLGGGTFSVNGEDVYIGLKFYPQSNTTRSVMTVWDIEEVQQ